MKKNLFLILIVFISGCNLSDETSALKENMAQEKVWTYIQFNVPEEGSKIGSFYYYSEISKALYEKISSNNLKSGFILLENVKYWNSDDEVIHEYSDLDHTGYLVFRIEDIRRIQLLRKEPR